MLYTYIEAVVFSVYLPNATAMPDDSQPVVASISIIQSERPESLEISRAARELERKKGEKVRWQS